jgi:hypothetical protein
MSRIDAVVHDPSVADRALSHEVRKRRRATSPRCRAGRNMISSYLMYGHLPSLSGR